MVRISMLAIAKKPDLYPTKAVYGIDLLAIAMKPDLYISQFAQFQYPIIILSKLV